MALSATGKPETFMPRRERHGFRTSFRNVQIHNVHLPFRIALLPLFRNDLFPFLEGKFLTTALLSLVEELNFGSPREVYKLPPVFLIAHVSLAASEIQIL